MNRAFTNKISRAQEDLFMHSETEELADFGPYDTEKRQPKSFEFYEEYSRCSIIETIKARRGNYDKADAETKRELQTEVEREVEDFCVWLEEVKKLDSIVAHNYSVGIKSLLLGLPTGVRIAQLFDVVLERQVSSMP